MDTVLEQEFFRFGMLRRITATLSGRDICVFQGISDK